MLNNKKGATLNDMASSWFLGSVPGGSLRAFMLVMTLVIDALLFTGSYYIAFSPKQSLVTKTDCTPATYPDPISHIDELGTFLQGDVDLALVYAYLLPLGDGAIGGWSSWPLANPAPKFSLSRDGTVYLQRVQCFEEYAASLNTSSDGTVIHMSSSQVFGNFFHGTFLVYMPAGSQESAFDAGHGIWQECTAIVGFGMGTVEFNFASDEWDMVIFSTISKIKLDQRNAVEQGSSKSRYFEEFRPMITSMPRHFSSYIPSNPHPLSILPQPTITTLLLSTNPFSKKSSLQIMFFTRRKVPPFATYYHGLLFLMDSTIQILLGKDSVLLLESLPIICLCSTTEPPFPNVNI